MRYKEKEAYIELPANKRRRRDIGCHGRLLDKVERRTGYENSRRYETRSKPRDTAVSPGTVYVCGQYLNAISESARKRQTVGRTKLTHIDELLKRNAGNNAGAAGMGYPPSARPYAPPALTPYPLIPFHGNYTGGTSLSQRPSI